MRKLAVQTWIYGNPEVRYEGCVINTYERNGYNDSDWYAECWDRQKKKIVTVEYDTTRCAAGGRAEINATPDVLREVYRMWRNVGRELFDKHENEAEAKKFEKGDTVLVIRGTKVKKGTVGVVFWKGTRYNCYSHRYEARIGIEVDGEHMFLAEEYAINANWKGRLLTGKARKQKIRNFAVNSLPRHYRNLFCDDRRGTENPWKCS